MQIGRQCIPLLAPMATVALAMGCSDAPEPRQPLTKEPTIQAAPAPEPREDRSEAIRARNDEILERLRQEELARKNRTPSQPEAPAPETPTEEPEPGLSGMEEMRARAAELEPRMAAIGRIADRIDDNYRRYMDACHEKYTTGTASPHLAMEYYDPYQPIAVNNETTPYCRKLWSDIETGANDVDLAMDALIEDARQRGVLPGHLRELARKYRLDRNGWRP